MDVTGRLLATVWLTSGGLLYRVAIGRDGGGERDGEGEGGEGQYVNILDVQGRDLQLVQNHSYSFTALVSKSMVHEGQKCALFVFVHGKSECRRLDTPHNGTVPAKFVHRLGHLARMPSSPVSSVQLDGMVLVDDSFWAPVGGDASYGHLVAWQDNTLFLPCALFASPCHHGVLATWIVRQHARDVLLRTVGESSIASLSIASRHKLRFDIHQTLFPGSACPCLGHMQQYLDLGHRDSMLCFVDQHRAAIQDRQRHPKLAIPGGTHECIALLRGIRWHHDWLVCASPKVLLSLDRPMVQDAVPAGCTDLHRLPTNLVHDTIVSVCGIAGWREPTESGRAGISLIDVHNRSDVLTFYLPPGPAEPDLLFLALQLGVHSEVHVTGAVLRRGRHEGRLLLVAHAQSKIVSVVRRSAVACPGSARNVYYLDEIARFGLLCVSVRVMVLRMVWRSEWRAVCVVCDARGSMKMVVEGRDLLRRLPPPLSHWSAVTCAVLGDGTLYLHAIQPIDMYKHSGILLDILKQRRPAK